jgi:hypothetical protein
MTGLKNENNVEIEHYGQTLFNVHQFREACISGARAGG